MKYAIEMGSGAMIYIPSFRKFGSCIQKLIGGDTKTRRHRRYGDRISLILFFQNKKSRLKNKRSLKRSFCCVCVCVSPSIVARQRLIKHVRAATNTHETIDLLEAVFSVRSVSHQILSM
jgi:hypothetical protein